MWILVTFNYNENKQPYMNATLYTIFTLENVSSTLENASDRSIEFIVFQSDESISWTIFT